MNGIYTVCHFVERCSPLFFTVGSFVQIEHAHIITRGKKNNIASKSY